MIQSERPPVWASIAQQLRQQRHDNHIGIDQIARRAQMSPVSIDAIEQGRFERFPSPYYAAGSARSYAAAVGLSDQGVSQAVLDGFAALPSAPARDGWQAVPEWATWLMLGAGMAIVALLLALIVHLLR